MEKEKLKEFQLNPHYEVELKPNTKIAVGWYMNKYQAFDKRVGIFGKKAKNINLDNLFQRVELSVLLFGII